MINDSVLEFTMSGIIIAIYLGLANIFGVYNIEREMELSMDYVSSDIPDTVPVPSLNDMVSRCEKSRECMTMTEVGYYEARGEDDIGVISVMHTVKSRVDDPRWPNGVYNVAYQRKQFSYTHDGSKRRGMKNREQLRRMKIYAYEVVNGLIDSPLGDVTHYHNLSVRPSWRKDLNYLAHVGNHVFYKGY